MNSFFSFFSSKLILNRILTVSIIIIIFVIIVIIIIIIIIINRNLYRSVSMRIFNCA